MTTRSKFLLFIMTFCLIVAVYAQSIKTVNYFANIKDYDLTKLWRADSIQTEADGQKIAFPEPIGYIGDSYQRFYIHYLNVRKNKANPYQYEVYGKTKVKENLCNFRGKITVKKAMLYNASRYPGYKQGLVICELLFYEDSMQASTGSLRGTLTSKFTIDKAGELQYDALSFVSDRYCNNQCSAIWTSYKTGKSKKTNWGDFRMPDSKELDIGVGDVSINEKFIQNGWQTFVNAYSAGNEKARKDEDAKWWE